MDKTKDRFCSAATSRGVKTCYKCGDPSTLKHKSECNANELECFRFHKLGHLARMWIEDR